MSYQEECERCRATGYLVCDKCRGKGKVKTEPPPSAIASGVDEYYVTCDKCRGGGMAKCPTCEGTGVVTIVPD